MLGLCAELAKAKACIRPFAAMSLPDGYSVGEKVFYIGSNHTFACGDRVVHGMKCEVTGPARRDSHKGQGVALLFSGINGSIDCFLKAMALQETPKRPMHLTSQ